MAVGPSKLVAVARTALARRDTVNDPCPVVGRVIGTEYVVPLPDGTPTEPADADRSDCVNPVTASLNVNVNVIEPPVSTLVGSPDHVAVGGLTTTTGMHRGCWVI